MTVSIPPGKLLEIHSLMLRIRGLKSAGLFFMISRRCPAC